MWRACSNGANWSERPGGRRHRRLRSPKHCVISDAVLAVSGKELQYCTAAAAQGDKGQGSRRVAFLDEEASSPAESGEGSSSLNCASFQDEELFLFRAWLLTSRRSRRPLQLLMNVLQHMRSESRSRFDQRVKWTDPICIRPGGRSSSEFMRSICMTVVTRAYRDRSTDCSPRAWTGTVYPQTAGPLLAVPAGPYEAGDASF